MNIISAKEIKKPSALRIIYSAPGMGKTTTIQYMPGKKLVIDLDGTSSVLKGLGDIDVATMDDPDNPRESLPKLLKEIKDKYLDQYESFALDNISELENAVLTEYGKKGNNNGVPGIQNYQQLQFFELDMIRYMKNWHKNILITAWETNDDFTTEGGQVFSRAYPQIRKPILGNVMGLALQVGRLQISPKSGKRGIILKPSNSIFAKNQIDNREFAMQEDLFKDGDVDVHAADVSAKNGGSSQGIPSKKK